MNGAMANFSAILNFRKAHVTFPLEVITLLKLKFLKYQKKVGSLFPWAYERDPMVFNQYCLDFFTKVCSQANQYGLKRSLRPSGETRQGPRPGMVMGEGASLL